MNTGRKTKIVCSLGPSTSDDTVVRNLILAGMNIARLNMSHGNHDEHSASIERVKRLSSELGIPVAILLDTRGPEIRTAMTESGKNLNIREGDPVIIIPDTSDGSASGDGRSPGNGIYPGDVRSLCKEPENGNPFIIYISWKEAAEKLKSGHKVLIADGLLELDVLDINGSQINCIAKNTASISGRKNVNLIGLHANLPIMSDIDREDIAFGTEKDVDFIAASFVSFPEEITEIRSYLSEINSKTRIIAKIENAEGLENIRAITQLADGIMIARGDLGVQLPTELIPLAQKNIIDVCRRAGKPVITATQMLESMIVNPRPTRAELTDVANAVLDGTDAIMLSGETTIGAYPVESVKTMDRIARTIEESTEFRTKMKNSWSECLSDAMDSSDIISNIISRSGVEISASVGAKAIVTPTYGGTTARILSVFRPDVPIIAVTPDQKAERIMQLYWGVQTFLRPHVDDSESMIQHTMKTVSDAKVANISDKLVLVAGLPLNSPTVTNTVRVLILGTVLAQSVGGGYSNPGIFRARGRIIHALTPEDARNRIKSHGGGEILVCDVLTEDYTPILRLVNGVICEGVSLLSEEQLRYTNPRLVWLTQISNAVKKLESGLTVTIDAKEHLVYEGSI